MSYHELSVEERVTIQIGQLHGCVKTIWIDALPEITWKIALLGKIQVCWPGAPPLTHNGGYVQLPGTDKALLVENGATDGDPCPPNFWRSNVYTYGLRVNALIRNRVRHAVFQTQTTTST
ncbi:hypothetical protein D9M68_106060 [compost metagenome]